MFTIDIDTGGTFTDGFFTSEGEFKTVKVLTTPHDLTVCLANCIEEASKLFGITVNDLLHDTVILRYSSTIGVNTLITKTGAKIGLIVTKGYKDSLYTEASDLKEAVYGFISSEMIDEVDEEIDERGNALKEIDKAEVLEKMQHLIENGARAITVSLKNSHLNPTHEKQIRKIIKEQYPTFLLGSLRVFLASDISDQSGDFCRTNTIVLNAYIHDSLVRYLYKAEEDMRDKFYQHPLMVAHSSGGVARVAKTRALDTCSSGPALGLIGTSVLGKMYGLENLLSVDIGGTSVDLGLIRDGLYSYETNPVLGGLPLNIAMIETYSAPMASGSIAYVDDSNKVRVGPTSAGASPGPACFDLGGMEPTVTDADIVLGLIDPDYFLGGRIKLNKELAVRSITTKIAEPLDVNPEDAAFMIKETAEKNIQFEILKYLKKHGIDREAINKITLVAYGGAGATHCCGFSKDLGFERLLTTPYASVFSAFGSCTTDLIHSYNKYIPLTLFDGSHYLSEYGMINEIIEEAIHIAKRDIAGEGFLPENANYYLEFLGDGRSKGMIVKSEKLIFEKKNDVKELCEKFNNMNGNTSGEISISGLVVNAVVLMPHFEHLVMDLGDKEPAPAALRGERKVLWKPGGGYEKTPVYERSLLVPGNEVSGPAIIDSKDTTYVVPEDTVFLIDKYSNGIFKEA